MTLQTQLTRCLCVVAGPGSHALDFGSEGRFFMCLQHQKRVIQQSVFTVRSRRKLLGAIDSTSSKPLGDQTCSRLECPHKPSQTRVPSRPAGRRPMVPIGERVGPRRRCTAVHGRSRGFVRPFLPGKYNKFTNKCQESLKHVPVCFSLGTTCWSIMCFRFCFVPVRMRR